MTAEQKDFAIKVLSHEDMAFVISSLAFVNLGDEEIDVLIYRYMRKHTQEEAAEYFKCSVNHIYDVQKVALEKCWKVWHKMLYVCSMVNTAL